MYINYIHNQAKPCWSGGSAGPEYGGGLSCGSSGPEYGGGAGSLEMVAVEVAALAILVNICDHGIPAASGKYDVIVLP